MSTPNVLMIALSPLIFVAGVCIIWFRCPLARIMMAGLNGMYGEKAKIIDSGKGAAHHLIWAGGGGIVFSLLLLGAGLFVPPEAFWHGRYPRHLPHASEYSMDDPRRFAGQVLQGLRDCT